jgi:outer membrane lipoprotein SlyB
MKKSLILVLSSAMVLSGCDTYTGSGAYAGASFGSILGSAIGGLSDGPRGSDIGTIIGMAGGAIVGAAIGQQTDQRRNEDAVAAEARRAERIYQRQQQQDQSGQSRNGSSYQQQGDDSYQQYGNNSQVQSNGNNSSSQEDVEGSGFNKENSGDDRIYDFTGSDYTGSYSAQKPTTVMPQSSNVDKSLSYAPELEIRDARFVDDNKDNVISRGEVCKVIFEVINKGTADVTDVQPTVWETTGNRHIMVSPSIHVERIAPGKGIRYTAIVQADNRLRDGNVSFHVAVLQGDKAISKVAVFNIPTRK